MSDENSHILSCLQRLETSVKELGAVATDVAVVKAKVGTIEVDMEGLKRSLFNSSTPDGNIFDRMTRTEDRVKVLTEAKLDERVSRVESDFRNNAMTKDACKESHNQQSSRMWRITAPLIVASIIAIAGLFYEGVIKKPVTIDTQVELMRKLLREELKLNSDTEAATQVHPQ